MCKEQRAYRRIPTNIRSRFYCNETDYYGTITNISETGMYIDTCELTFPFDSIVEIFIRQRGALLKVPVRVCRLTKSHNAFDGMGVQVIEPAPDYLKFVKSLKSTVTKPE